VRRPVLIAAVLAVLAAGAGAGFLLLDREPALPRREVAA
jgi:hypothetical protein